MVSLEKNEIAGDKAISKPVVSKPILPNLLRKGYNKATTIIPNRTGKSLKEKSVKPKI